MLGDTLGLTEGLIDGDTLGDILRLTDGLGEILGLTDGLIDGLMTAATTSKFALRWTSTQGELGSTGFLVDAFVDGTKETSLYSTGYRAYRGPVLLWDPYAAEPSAQGYISNLTILPICLSDEEIAAW